MKEIRLINPMWDEIASAIKHINSARQASPSNMLLNRIWHDVIKPLNDYYGETSPMATIFLYSPSEPKGVVLKGYLVDIETLIKDEHPNCIAHIVLFKSGTSKVPQKHKIWRGYGRVRVQEPTPSTDIGLRQRVGSDKYQIQIGNRIFVYKRLPNKWLNEWTNAIEET